jgi:hypothetical protein
MSPFSTRQVDILNGVDLTVLQGDAWAPGTERRRQDDDPEDRVWAHAADAGPVDLSLEGLGRSADLSGEPYFYDYLAC